MEKIKIAIVGATGLVGQTFLKILEENNVDNIEVKLFASLKSQGSKIKFKDKYHIVHGLDETSFYDVDYACFFSSPCVSKIYVPIALKRKIKVIDNSSCFRMKKDVLLIAYGANDNLINKNENLICNPNCCVIQSIIPINLLKNFNIKRIIYNTYQSVSGSGKQGIDDLIRCRKGEIPTFYETDISFTCIPKIGDYQINNFTDEENKMIAETKKILNDDSIDVLATCIRVPVMFSHGVSVQIDFEKQIDLEAIKDIFKKQPNIVFCDKIPPTSVLSCKNDKIYLGRLRKENNSLLFYCVADNIRVGAATNTFYILKKLIGEDFK